MSCFIATLTDKAAWLSADTLACEPIHNPDHELIAATEDGDEAVHSAYVGGGGPHTVKVIGRCSKVWIAPHLSIAMTGAGHWIALAQFAEVIGTSPEITSIEDVPTLAGIWLPALCADKEIMAVVVGWSHAEHRIRGFAFTCSPAEFSQVELQPNTHTMCPAPCPESDGYDSIVRMQDGAKQGLDVQTFHKGVIANVHAAYLSGRLRPGVGVGRDLVSACVGPVGIHVQSSA